MWEHNEGIYDNHTAKRRPGTPVFAEIYDRITDANAGGRQIKGWSRVKKDAPTTLGRQMALKT